MKMPRLTTVSSPFELELWLLPGGLALALLILGGCAVGPDYRPPRLAVPSDWSTSLAYGETNPAPSLAQWWRIFKDPVLDSLVDQAEKANLDLRIAQARIREARARYRVAAADLQPAVDSAGSYARQNQSHHQPLIGSLPLPANVPFENNVYQAGFDASWEIDIFGGSRRTLEASKAEVEAVESGFQNVLVTLLGEVARDYVEIRGCQQRLAIARENIKAQEDGLAIARDRFHHGLASDLDVRQAATLLANTRADVPSLEIQIETSIHRLGVLLAQPPTSLLAQLSEPAPIPAALTQVPAGLPSDLLLRRPDVRRAERELAAATAGIGAATANLFPKFFLTGAAGLESVSAGDWFDPGSRFWSVGPTVQWRIFDAGRIRANIRVQSARQEQALAAYEKAALISFEEVEDALVAYAKEQVRRRSLMEAVKTSQDSLHLANQLYINGLASLINVLDAERSLYHAEDALVQSEASVTQDAIALYKALGGGWDVEKRVAALRGNLSSRRSFAEWAGGDQNVASGRKNSA